MDTRKLLEELENVINNASEVPLTNKKLVDKDEIERLIDIDSEPKVFDDTLYLAAYRGNVAGQPAMKPDGGGRQPGDEPVERFAGARLIAVMRPRIMPITFSTSGVLSAVAFSSPRSISPLA